MQEEAIQLHTVSDDGIYDKYRDTSDNGCCFYCNSVVMDKEKHILIQNRKFATRAPSKFARSRSYILTYQVCY